MRNLKITFFVPTILLLSFLMVVFAHQPDNRSTPKHRLAIEIGLSKPFTLTAATAGHTLEAFLPVPATATSESQVARFAAIKLATKMVGDKIEVTVSVLSGDTSVIKSCEDWGALKESPITSYTLGEGEEVTVSKLSDLGPNFKNGTLTFRAVTLIAPLQREKKTPKCGCGSCFDGTVCCPNSGQCMSCSNCGTVCCK